MSNPFLVPGSVNAERERKRRQKFKTTTFAVLLATSCFLMGMLIQGCNDQHRGMDREEVSGFGFIQE